MANTAVLIVALGILLYLGKSVLLPILAAVIVVYVLVNTSAALGRVPVIGRLPESLRRLAVLLIFIAALVVIVGVVVSTISQILSQAPTYQANIEKLVAQGADLVGIDERPDWQTIRAATFGRFSIQSVINTAFLNVTGIAGPIFLVIVYSAFLLAERAGFSRKLALVMPDPEDAARTATIIRDINDRIGAYLAIKTLVNVILAVISYAILWGFGIDFPLFWALAIGLLNYIPYFGSLLAVLFPVALSVVQFGDLAWTLLLGALLTIAQMIVGSFVEPRLIGRRVNLSPFIVLVSLAVWTALWGLPGALLAVPLTSMMTIVLSAFAPTRPIALMMADRVLDDAPRGPLISPAP